MIIGLISDTHAAGSGRNLPDKILRSLEGVDLILHCGDLECLGVLDYLESVAPVLAVRGYEDPTEPGSRLAYSTRVVQVEGVAIGMTHDIQWPGPRIVPTLGGQSEPGLEFPSGAPRDLMAKTFGQKVDAVVFGDTHQEMIKSYGGVLVVNPGSPTYPCRGHSTGALGTIGILEVSQGQIDARLVNLETVE
ncbi:MAG: hypothetical protein BZY88_07610 [SAR202 cluster bacterium Io17-Chloro-G9]|nr:MAG: hypothetical protein BZY88_07610 [SAR202 cluster bacterium Io17-Chloro-G9]